MGKIYIDEKICRGCRLCRKACPFGAIEIYERVAHISEKCRLCQKCKKACPFGAIKTT